MQKTAVTCPVGRTERDTILLALHATVAEFCLHNKITASKPQYVKCYRDKSMLSPENALHVCAVNIEWFPTLEEDDT